MMRRFRDRRPTRRLLAVVLLAASLLVTMPLAASRKARPPAPPATPAPPLAAAAGDRLARAQELVENGRAEEAMQILDAILAARPDDAKALLARSTAHFLLGETAPGRSDLDRALALDPGLRQGWLNRAALALSEKRYDDALAALRKAQELDPDATDNDVNIGAVLLLEGDLEQASRLFAAYLAANPASAEAAYLVATNYALAGYAALAVENLRRAIALDEKVRLQARTDPNFSDLSDHPAFQELMATDAHRPPAGGYSASKEYRAAYDGGQGPLLGAVLDALQMAGTPFDRRVEVTPDWALVWSDVRIKVHDAAGGGVVELSAPAASFTPAEWERRRAELYRQIAVHLATSEHATAPPPPPSR